MTTDLAPSTPPQTHEISTTDESNPRSVVRLVPASLSTNIKDALFEHPEFFDKDERALWTALRLANAQPTPTDNRLRLKFWMEYDRAQGTSADSMNMTNVYSGICSKEYFYKHYITKPQKLGWLMCPPTGYLIKAEEALEFGIEQLRDILDQPHVFGQKVDVKLGELKAKIVLMLDTRVKGAPVQRNMNLNVHTSDAAVAKAASAATAEELMRELKELERRNRIAQNLPNPGKPDIEIS